MEKYNPKAPTSLQDRSNQPKRAGGNCADYGIEAHGQKRGTKIKNAAGNTGDESTQFGFVRDSSVPSIEKHGHGAEFVAHLNGQPANAHRNRIPENIQVDDRGSDTSGNCSKGGVEKCGQKKGEYVDGGLHRL
jgi:hypothetical protein